MTTATTQLDRLSQELVDEHLDAIDRVLLHAGVSRTERHGIVTEVAAQIQELLGRRGPGEPRRADVRAVLAALDPPDAYAPEGAAPPWESAGRFGEVRRRVVQPSLLAVGSAFGGVLLLLLAALLFWAVLEGGGGDALVLLLLAGPVLLVGAAVAATGVLGIRQIRASDGWLTGLPLAVFGAVLFPLLILNGLALTAAVAFDEIGLFILSGLAFVGANAYLVAQVWRWVATDAAPAAATRVD